jgi:hypothetical protein
MKKDLKMSFEKKFNGINSRNEELTKFKKIK